MKNPEWTKLDEQLEVPIERGLPDIMVRLAYLDAAVQTIAQTLLCLCEAIDPKHADPFPQFKDMLGKEFNVNIAQLVSKYHRSDAPDETSMRQ